MRRPRLIWSTLFDGVTVHHVDHASVTICGELLMARIRQHMATTEQGDVWSTGPTWGMVNELQSSTELLIVWALYPTMAVVDRPAILDRHQVTMVACGFGDSSSGSKLTARDQAATSTPLTTMVSSILVAGTDRFEVWASLLDPHRLRRECDAQLIAEIERRPGTEVLIHRTASVENGDGRVWIIGHAVTDASDDCVALVIRRRGRPP